MRYPAAMRDDETRDHGVQPLDAIMTRWGIASHRLVERSAEQLTHKQVQRARKGRQLTLHMMQKLTRALNETVLFGMPEEQRGNFTPYLHRHLFNYAKNHDPAWQDPNDSLMPQ